VAVLPAPPLRGVAGGQPVIQGPGFVCFISAVFLLIGLVILWFCGFSFFAKERKIRRKRKTSYFPRLLAFGEQIICGGVGASKRLQGKIL